MLSDLPPGFVLCAFFVPGVPQTKGSTKSYGIGMVRNDNPNEKAWARAVGWAAKMNNGGRAPVLAPIHLWVRFRMPRPARPRYAWPSVGDEDKLARSLADAMTGIVYVDDRHIVDTDAKKRYAKPGCPPGADVRVSISNLDEDS